MGGGSLQSGDFGMNGNEKSPVEKKEQELFSDLMGGSSDSKNPFDLLV